MMFGYRIICVTPAGRARYLKLLSQHILSSPIVDEYQLRGNATNHDDLDFLRALEASDPRIKIIEPIELAPGSNASIRQFFRHCTNERTIYIWFDDDRARLLR